MSVRLIGAFESIEYKRYVLQEARKYGVEENIEWRGFRKDISSELRGLDIFVLPSLFGEGLPMALLEAMAHGLPIVAAAAGGVPEAITQGVEGYIVPPGDEQALAQAIEDLLTNPNKIVRFGQQAQYRQRMDFDIDITCERLAHVYKRLLDLERNPRS